MAPLCHMQRQSCSVLCKKPDFVSMVYKPCVSQLQVLSVNHGRLTHLQMTNIPILSKGLLILSTMLNVYNLL